MRTFFFSSYFFIFFLLYCYVKVVRGIRPSFYGRRRRRQVRNNKIFFGFFFIFFIYFLRARLPRGRFNGKTIAITRAYRHNRLSGFRGFRQHRRSYKPIVFAAAAIITGHISRFFFFFFFFATPIITKNYNNNNIFLFGDRLRFVGRPPTAVREISMSLSAGEVRLESALKYRKNMPKKNTKNTKKPNKHALKTIEICSRKKRKTNNIYFNYNYRLKVL